MNKTVLCTLVALGALAATDALAQASGFVGQDGREFRPPSEAGRAPARSQRPEQRGALDARAERRGVSPAAYDGSWSVAISTRSGACEPHYRFGVQIINGNVVHEGRTSGRVSPNGAVQVTVTAGDQQANGQGRLSRDYGTGVWRGYGSSGACAGTWVAERRDY